MVVEVAVFITTQQSIQMLERMGGLVVVGLLHPQVLALEEVEILPQHLLHKATMVAHQVVSEPILEGHQEAVVAQVEPGLLGS
jgi:hypothetical protein